MGRSALRSTLLVLMAVTVSVAAHRPMGSECSTCCAVIKAQASATHASEAGSCCAQHQREPCTTPAPIRPCGACCRPSEPLAKADAPRREFNDPINDLLASIVLDAATPDADASSVSLNGACRIHPSDPSLRVLLCNWRN